MSTSGIACRHAFSAALLETARKNGAIYAVCSDSKGSAAMGDYADALPGQFVEAGIAEQDAIGLAAGLSRCGKTVFVCGPACFYATRSLEQLKIDVAYARSDVKVIGISGGVSYGALGSTHHTLHDIAVMRTFPNLDVFLPCDAAETAAVTQYMASSGNPAYMRIGRGPVADVYGPGAGAEFRPGRANLLREGNDCTIVAAGEMVQLAVAAADILAGAGIKARVLDCWSIKPFDEAAIRSAARETRFIVTLEEHSVHGGLGAAVAEIVVQTAPLPMKLLGFPDEWAPAGTSAELFAYYGFTAEKIAATVAAFGASLAAPDELSLAPSGGRIR